MSGDDEDWGISPIQMSTTELAPGHEITTSLGIAYGEMTHKDARNPMRSCLKSLHDAASEAGADAVVAVRVVSVAPDGHLFAYGTAVLFESDDADDVAETANDDWRAARGVLHLDEPAEQAVRRARGG